MTRVGSLAESDGDRTWRLLVRNETFFHICGATIKLETRAWFDPGASRLVERICGRAGVGPESCRVRHTALDRCEMRQMQQVKPKVEARICTHVWSRFDNNTYVSHKFHLLLVCICLVSCSHEKVKADDQPHHKQLPGRPREDAFTNHSACACAPFVSLTSFPPRELAPGRTTGGDLYITTGRLHLCRQ